MSSQDFTQLSEKASACRYIIKFASSLSVPAWRTGTAVCGLQNRKKQNNSNVTEK